MPPPAPARVDPVFAEIAKAIYGDDVDVRELAKFSPGSSDVHVDGPMTEDQAKKQKRIAQTGLAATGVATAGGLHAIKATTVENKVRGAAAAVGDPAAGKATTGIARLAHIKPKTAAAVVGGGMLALHGVELLGDGLGARAQLKAVNAANAAGAKKKPDDKVTKAFRLKALNALPDRVPSLRAKRPKLTPQPANPTTKAGLYQPVSKGVRSGIKGARQTARDAKDTASHAEEVTRRLKVLIPTPRTAALAAGGTLVALTGATYAGTRSGTKAGTKAGAKVSKSELDVTWTGVIAKVDADKRQVFGWASVSRINGEDVVDLQGDIVPIEEIEKSAYRYVIDSRKGGDMHRRVSKLDQPLHTADMIESFVVTPEKLAKMGLPANSLPHGWWCGFHVNDDAQWAMVKSGERAGFSIHGTGKRTPLSKRARNRAMMPAVEGQAPKAAKRARLIPLNVPMHSADKGVQRANKARLMLHRYTPLIHAATDGIMELAKGDRTEKLKERAEKVIERSQIKERAEQAIHPPAVKLSPVKSTAVEAMGYQRQTKRLAVQMRSRPGKPYEYKMRAGSASDALTAPSKGRYFATEIRGKAKRAKGYTPADRARLFLDPVSKKKGDRTMSELAQSAFGATTTLSKADPPRRQITSGPVNDTGRNIGPSDAAPKGRTGRPRVTSMPPKYEMRGNASEFGRGAKGGYRASTANWARKDKNAKAVRQVVMQRVVSGHTGGSPHPGAFKTGIKAGKIAGHGARFALPAAAVGAVAGINEIKRRDYNRKGANLSYGESITHPIRAQSKKVGANQLELHRRAVKSAATSERRSPGSNRAAAAESRANQYAYKAQRADTQARIGLRAAGKTSKPYDRTQTYRAPAKIGKGMPGERPARTELPGDNRDAQMARSRRKVGLGTAGVGFLAATRGKEVAPAVADAATPKFLNGAKHADRVARRTKFVGSTSSKVGGAAVIGGLALAGEGAVSDLRNRKAFSRTHQQVKDKVGTLRKSAFGVEHDEVSKAGFGDLLSGVTKPVMAGADKLSARLKPLADSTQAAAKPIIGNIKTATKPAANAFKHLTPGKQLGVVGAAAGGTGLVAGLAKPDNTVTKAFDSERARHSRQDMYAGAATGGAVLAGGGAVKAGRGAVKVRQAANRAAARSATANERVRTNLGSMSQPAKTRPTNAQGKVRTIRDTARDTGRLHESGTRSARVAAELGGKARRLTRVSVGSALGAAALGAAAYGAHDYDRRRGGRSYGY